MFSDKHFILLGLFKLHFYTLKNFRDFIDFFSLKIFVNKNTARQTSFLSERQAKAIPVSAACEEA